MAPGPQAAPRPGSPRGSWQGSWVGSMAWTPRRGRRAARARPNEASRRGQVRGARTAAGGPEPAPLAPPPGEAILGSSCGSCGAEGRGAGRGMVCVRAAPPTPRPSPGAGLVRAALPRGFRAPRARGGAGRPEQAAGSVRIACRRPGTRPGLSLGHRRPPRELWKAASWPLRRAPRTLGRPSSFSAAQD